MRELLGVLLKDLPRYLLALAGNGTGYLALCNRAEHLERAPDGDGYRCAWQWTSDLHAPKLLPFLGRWLMRRALVDHPIRRFSQPVSVSGQPKVSFIVGHRGMARLPHLLATLESIAGQKDVAFECIVVEQETVSQLAGKLPSWVRHIHTPPPDPDMPYCRSWAFNVGARYARGGMLILHDNDILVPSDCASQHWDRVAQGYEVINLKRFIFFVDEPSTNALFAGETDMSAITLKCIMQNAEGGGSIAITRQAFERIGGMDESFIGWGGEDNEFWERAQACKVWPYGCLPLVHLWHPSQPWKYQSENPTLKHCRDLSKIPVVDRIERLKAANFGDMAGPVGYEDERTQD
jgi:hypothetical protein